MPVFEYEVADRAGALSRGRAQAENAGDLILRFREQGRLVVAIRPAAGDGEVLVGAAAPALTESIRQTLLRLSSGVGLGTLVLFTGQLAAMLGGGLHLVRILTSLAGETTNQKFRKVLMSVRDAVTGGTSFADAFLRASGHVVLRGAGQSVTRRQSWAEWARQLREDVGWLNWPLSACVPARGARPSAGLGLWGQ